MELNEKNLLAKKKKREETNNKYDNFIELYSKNEKAIKTLSSKEKNYRETLKKNKSIFFNQYGDILSKSKNKPKEKKQIDKIDNSQKDQKKEDNENTTEQENKTNDNNKDKNNDDNIATDIKDNPLKDIISYDKKSNSYYFTEKYDEMLIDFFKTNTNSQKYSSLFNDIMQIDILANILEFPFYYLIIDKSNINDKLIFFKKNEIFEVYDFKNKRNKTDNEFKFLFISLIQKEFYENHYIIVCSFMES